MLDISWGLTVWTLATFAILIAVVILIVWLVVRLVRRASGRA
jgi:flagellar biogenesis protein FliO